MAFAQVTRAIHDKWSVGKRGGSSRNRKRNRITAKSRPGAFFRTSPRRQRGSRKATRRGGKSNTRKYKITEAPGGDRGQEEELIFNISSYILTASEASLLRRGLGYVPMVSGDPFSHTVDNFKFSRHVRLKEKYAQGTGSVHRFPHIEDADSEQAPGLTTAAADGLSENARSMSPAIEKFKLASTYDPISSNASIKTFNRMLDADVMSHYNKRRKWRGNLTVVEKEAIKSLKQNKDIIIKTADKGGGIVVMNYSYYKQELLSQLADTTKYNRLSFDPTVNFQNELRLLLQMAKSNGWVTESMCEFFLPAHPIRPVIYTLPKGHKSLHTPPGRPIISSNGSLNEGIAAYVDSLLQPCVQNMTSYLKDTNDFLKMIRSISCPITDMVLVTMDVQSLYTCIPHDAGVEAVQELVIGNALYTGPPVEFMLDLLRFILHKNYFKFENEYFVQRTGTAMGSKVAPAYANAFMHKFESDHILCHPLFRQYGAFYRRYIDDVFYVWLGPIDKLDEFVGYLNDLDSPVKFTAKYDLQQIDFLDVKVYKENSQLQTCVYRKPTDRNTLTHYHSNHPRHLLNSLPKSQMLRVVRIDSDPKKRSEDLMEMYGKFLDRGYPSKLLLDTKQWALSLDREEVLLEQEEHQNVRNRGGGNDIYYVSKYGANSAVVNDSVLRHWPILKTDDTISKKLPDRPKFSYARGE
ncbi:uncharacterized protein LOC121393224 [Xenopus laevis]|uniref:Uncharacterized protein LOC121393224 n=1 Tax=Xenopus laevis TaxID=8355 RepID=A0A8J1KIB2_XENLA|nr:uncharacterized protein LOC121393224 [Xenopus laevis]